MKTFQLEQYEVNDLIRILEYALKKKKEDYKSNIINEYEFKMYNNSINNLLNRFPRKYDTKNLDKDMLKII